TAGLPNDLNGLKGDGDPAAQATAEGDPLPGKHYALFFDFQDLGLFGIKADCTAEDRGPDTVDVLGAELATHRIVEDCEIAPLRWSFENTFWVDPVTGLPWRSRQYVHPKLSAVTIDLFRPPASPAAAQ